MEIVQVTLSLFCINMKVRSIEGIVLINKVIEINALHSNERNMLIH